MAKDYIASTADNYQLLYSIAKDAGLSVNGNMSASQITQALKGNAGTSNSYGTTIGNETLSKYGYQTAKDGSISKISATPATSGGSSSYKQESPVPTGYTAPAAQNNNPQSAIDNAWNVLYNTYGAAGVQQNQAASYLQQQQEAARLAQEEARAKQEAAIRANTQATVDSINSNKEGINKAYNDAAQQAYVNMILSQNQMGDYLAAQGYTGGMAESTAQGIINNYENNRQQATSERDAALRQLEQLVAQAQTSGNTDLANVASEYLQNYANNLQNYSGMYLDAINMDRNYAQQQYENQWNEKVYQDTLNNQTKAEQQQRAEQEFQAFLNTYQTRYTNKDKYTNWIKQLRSQQQVEGDPYGILESEIQYLSAFVNSNLGQGSGTVYAGSGSGSTGNGGTTSSPADTQKVAPGTYATNPPQAEQLTSAQTNYYNDLLKQINGAKNANSLAVKTIELDRILTAIEGAKADKLTEAQKKELIALMK